MPLGGLLRTKRDDGGILSRWRVERHILWRGGIGGVRRTRFDSRQVSGGGTLLDDLAHLTCKLRLLWGERDGIVTPAYGAGWRQEIPGARLDIIPAAGHFPHWEQPETFVEHLTAFVDSRNA